MATRRKVKKEKKLDERAIRALGKNGKTKCFTKEVKKRHGFYQSCILKDEFCRIQNLDYDLFRKNGFNIISIHHHEISNWSELNPMTGEFIQQGDEIWTNVTSPLLDGITDVDGKPLEFERRSYLQNKIRKKGKEILIKNKKDLDNLKLYLVNIRANFIITKMVLDCFTIGRRCVFERVKNETQTGNQFDFMVTAIEDENGIIIPINQFQNVEAFLSIGMKEDGEKKEIVYDYCERKTGMLIPKTYDGCAYGPRPMMIKT